MRTAHLSINLQIEYYINCLKRYQRTTHFQHPSFIVFHLCYFNINMQGQSYINFLTFFQKFSQKISILYTPANHEFMKHSSIFPLIIQSFFSPFWTQFNGYFQLAKIGQHLFLGYNPDSIFGNSLYTQKYQPLYGKHLSFLKKQFNQKTIAQIYSNYTTIAFSHYPILCSEGTQHTRCSKYLQKQQPYLQILQKVGIDLMLSAHIHYYERSKPICLDNDKYLQSKGPQEIDLYQMKNCPIFEYWILFTGTLKKSNKDRLYSYFGQKRVRSEDHFIMLGKSKQLSNTISADLSLLFIVLVVLSTLLSVCLFVRHLIKHKLRQNNQSHLLVFLNVFLLCLQWIVVLLLEQRLYDTSRIIHTFRSQLSMCFVFRWRYLY